MDQRIVYLGSDHVIKTPDFELRKNSLRLSMDIKEAARQATRHNAAGILNAYRLDLDRLCVKAPFQEILDGFEQFDVEFPVDPEDNHLSLCSENALRSLEFLSASFVNQ